MSKSFSHTLTVLAVVLTACQDGSLDVASSPVAVAGSALAVAGDDTECTTTLVGGTYDNVVVPDGEVCFLIDATVDGNVDALKGSIFLMLRGTVDGNISGSEADGVFVNQVTLPNGNVQIVKSADFSVVQLSILEKGNIKVEENNADGRGTRVRGNDVAQNIQVYKNAGLAVRVFDNDAGESIQCFDNILPDPPGVVEIRDNTEPSGILVITISRCTSYGPPMGMTIRPPGLSCSQSGGGKCPEAHVTIIPSNGAWSFHPK